MSKTILAVLTIAVGIAASASVASADIYAGLPDWKVRLFTYNSTYR